TDYTEVYSMVEGEVWEVGEDGRPAASTGRRGIRIRFVDHWLNTPATSINPETPGTAEKAHAYAQAVGATLVAVDAAGVGRAVVDALAEKEDGTYEMFLVFGSNPPRKEDKATLVNIRAQGIFDLERKMARGECDIDGSDEEFLNQLRRVVFEYTDKGQKKIESKDSMKKRGLKSPDKVDAAWYAATDFSEQAENPY